MSAHTWESRSRSAGESEANSGTRSISSLVSIHPPRAVGSSGPRCGLGLDEIPSVSGSTPSCSIASAAAWVCIASITASMSGTSMSSATRLGFVGSTNVRMS